MEVLLGAVLVHALHAALEHAEIALNRVRVDDAATILALSVTHEVMTGEFAGQVLILTCFVRVDHSFGGNVRLEDRQKGGLLEVVHNDALGVTGVRSTSVSSLCL